MAEVNPTVGRIRCPISGKLAEVRRNKRGKLYYVGEAGMITPNLPVGQAWLLENAEMFKAEEVKKINENGLEFGRRFADDAEFQTPVKTEGGSCLIQ